MQPFMWVTGRPSDLTFSLMPTINSINQSIWCDVALNWISVLYERNKLLDISLNNLYSFLWFDFDDLWYKQLTSVSRRSSTVVNVFDPGSPGRVLKTVGRTVSGHGPDPSPNSIRTWSGQCSNSVRTSGHCLDIVRTWSRPLSGLWSWRQSGPCTDSGTRLDVTDAIITSLLALLW